MAEDDKQGENGDRVYHRPISEFEFLEWKRKKEDDASARRTEAARKRTQDIAAGVVQMNGRELFLHEPWVFDNTLY
ncbi:hypothetical protein HPP92_019111 [Vanilla planifolia]|uniref:ZC3H15/TMA46 family C-terminal domain-containing protein n=1 Tax=Vanilla planifolia TaxID=51239 RepID=A0A835UQ11_VANPL|nr:hypothetical protein HPP92_019111 [Vanilla planifolia]